MNTLFHILLSQYVEIYYEVSRKLVKLMLDFILILLHDKKNHL